MPSEQKQTAFTGQRGGVRVFLQASDCVEAMRSLKAESIDLVVTSPPYNLGIQYNAYQDTLTSDAYLDWSLLWMTEVKRVLKPDGALFLNIGASPKDPLMPHRLLLRATDLFVLQNTFHWVKSITVETIDKEIVSAGHFKPINSKRYVNDCHEFVYHLTRPNGTRPALGDGEPMETDDREHWEANVLLPALAAFAVLPALAAACR